MSGPRDYETGGQRGEDPTAADGARPACVDVPRLIAAALGLAGPVACWADPIGEGPLAELRAALGLGPNGDAPGPRPADRAPYFETAAEIEDVARRHLECLPVGITDADDSRIDAFRRALTRVDLGWSVTSATDGGDGLVYLRDAAGVLRGIVVAEDFYAIRAGGSASRLVTRDPASAEFYHAGPAGYFLILDAGGVSVGVISTERLVEKAEAGDERARLGLALAGWQCEWVRREDGKMREMARAPTPRVTGAAERPPGDPLGRLRRPLLARPGVLSWVDLEPCRCADRRGPAGGVCGACGGAIPSPEGG